MAKITWFGHATFKIEIADRIVLIDPCERSGISG